MGQDIREMFKNESAPKKESLPKGHKSRFEARLDEAFPETKKQSSNFFFLKIAAVLVVALGVGFALFNNPFAGDTEVQVADTPVQEEANQNEAELVPEKQFKLSEVSPEFKRVEDYYLASLNMELAKLEVNDDNRAVINAFMKQLAELDKEYEELNAEISKTGPSEIMLEAMINNLQLRLDLLYKVKSKIKEINQSKNNSYENLQA
ncbi:hypothetical protein ACW6QP_06480 [Salegentibacter sp. HM20]